MTEVEEDPLPSASAGVGASRRKKRSRASSISALQRLGLMKIVQESIDHTHVQPEDQTATLKKISEDEDDFDIDMADDSRLPIRKRHSNVMYGAID